MDYCIERKGFYPTVKNHLLLGGALEYKKHPEINEGYTILYQNFENLSDGSKYSYKVFVWNMDGFAPIIKNLDIAAQ